MQALGGSVTTSTPGVHEGLGEPVVGLLAAEFDAVRALAAAVPDDRWSTPTDLPGWTVQDCFSHMVGVEKQLLGEPEDTPPTDHLPHIKHEFAAAVEGPVELRRSASPAAVRAELDEVLQRRQAQLEDYGPEKFAEDSWTPAGPGQYRDFMNIRVFDLWMHEQDVRHAVNLPGHHAGPVVQSVLTNNAGKALPMVVGKKAGAAPGAVVAVELVGPTERSLVVGVRDVDGKTRASLIDSAPDEGATATVTTDVDTFMRLCGGRTTAATVLEADPGAITFAGDAALGRAVVDNLSFTP